ncbi:hypothetical protein ABT237_39655 [Streptomyces sp. NPDC001581]
MFGGPSDARGQAQQAKEPAEKYAITGEVADHLIAKERAAR